MTGKKSTEFRSYWESMAISLTIDKVDLGDTYKDLKTRESNESDCHGNSLIPPLQFCMTGRNLLPMRQLLVREEPASRY